MRRYIRQCLIIFLAAGCGAAFSGCGPSYPKAKVESAVLSVVKKEYNLEGTATLAGRTLYLEVLMPGLTSTDPKALPAVMAKIQGAVLAVTRISLSSDAQIRFLVVTAKDPTWKLGMRVIQRMDDVKDYLYQRISKSDYEGRLILELDAVPHVLTVPARPAVPEKPEEMQMDEFVGRLIVSQFNMFARSNPFLGVLLNDFKLQYRGLSGGELTVSVSDYVNVKTMPLVQKLLMSEALKVVKKYKLPRITTIRITLGNGQLVSVTEAMPK